MPVHKKRRLRKVNFKFANSANAFIQKSRKVPGAIKIFRSTFVQGTPKGHFKCPHCDVEFIRKSALLRHLNKTHPETKPALV